MSAERQKAKQKQLSARFCVRLGCYETAMASCRLCVPVAFLNGTICSVAEGHWANKQHRGSNPSDLAWQVARRRVDLCCRAHNHYFSMETHDVSLVLTALGRSSGFDPDTGGRVHLKHCHVRRNKKKKLRTQPKRIKSEEQLQRGAYGHFASTVYEEPRYKA